MGQRERLEGTIYDYGMRIFYKIEAWWLHWKHKRVLSYLDSQKGNTSWLLTIQCKLEEVIDPEDVSEDLKRSTKMLYRMVYKKKEKINPDAEIDL